jgi:hypothetical protein
MSVASSKNVEFLPISLIMQELPLSKNILPEVANLCVNTSLIYMSYVCVLLLGDSTLSW